MRNSTNESGKRGNAGKKARPAARTIKGKEKTFEKKEITYRKDRPIEKISHGRDKPFEKREPSFRKGRPADKTRPDREKSFEKKEPSFRKDRPADKTRPDREMSSGKKEISFRKGRPSGKTSHDREKSFEKKEHSEDIRLNRFIANAGICSRREADNYIKMGLIKVNDKLVTEVGTKIKPDDSVKFNGEILRTEQKVYILLNKPKDYITTVEDPHATKTVLDLIQGACRERVYPVGRLDRMTTGLLLLTNDGELTKKLTHPSYNKKKVYHVQLNKSLKAADFVKISNGIELEDGLIKPDALNYIDESDKSELGIEIHSGRNRIVRRIFENFDYVIRKLDRVYYAGLTKKNLPRGKWRFLTTAELAILKSGRYF